MKSYRVPRLCEADMASLTFGKIVVETSNVKYTEIYRSNLKIYAVLSGVSFVWGTVIVFGRKQLGLSSVSLYMISSVLYGLCLSSLWLGYKSRLFVRVCYINGRDVHIKCFSLRQANEISALIRQHMARDRRHAGEDRRKTTGNEPWIGEDRRKSRDDRRKDR